MDDEKRRKVDNALSWAKSMLDHLEEHSHDHSYETDKAAVYLRQALALAGHNPYRHRLSRDAMYTWLRIQESVEELEPLGEPLVMEKLKMAQAELHRLFTDEDLERYREREKAHKDDYAWVSCV